MKKHIAMMTGLAALAYTLTSCETTYYSRHHEGAMAGNAKDQWAIATCYRDGDGGVPGGKIDMEEAVKWFRKAADQGYGDAMVSLGVLYKTGNGVPQDKAKAAEYFEKAARQGNKYGQLNMGYMFVDLTSFGGYEVGTDEHAYVASMIRKAAYWFEMAAQQGLSAAQHELAICYDWAVYNNSDKMEERFYFNLGGDYKNPKAYWQIAKKWYAEAAKDTSQPKYQESYEKFLRTGSSHMSDANVGPEYLKRVSS